MIILVVILFLIFIILAVVIFIVYWNGSYINVGYPQTQIAQGEPYYLYNAKIGSFLAYDSTSNRVIASTASNASKFVANTGSQKYSYKLSVNGIPLSFLNGYLCTGTPVKEVYIYSVVSGYPAFTLSDDDNRECAFIDSLNRVSVSGSYGSESTIYYFYNSTSNIKLPSSLSFGVNNVYATNIATGNYNLYFPLIDKYLSYDSLNVLTIGSIASSFTITTNQNGSYINIPNKALYLTFLPNNNVGVTPTQNLLSIKPISGFEVKTLFMIQFQNSILYAKSSPLYFDYGVYPNTYSNSLIAFIPNVSS
jgi:hypothetical protein